jgi:nucleotide-binding universal stress UspA family protein
VEAQETSNGDRAASWIKRIVVAADGSPASTRGLEQAADLATRIGAKVFVVHVRHVPAAAGMGSAIASQQIYETLDELESEVRHQAVRILGGTSAAWEFVVREGSGGEEIVKVVQEVAADLVVVGSNRHSSLHNLILGSTAAYLTAHSPTPVLVMRSPAETSTEPVKVAVTE